MDKELIFLKKYLVGGVNSPVRSFKNVNLEPIIIKKAKGSKIFDIYNKEYIDFCMGWGSIIIGHSNNEIINQVNKALYNGLNFGFTTKTELKLAKLISEAIPSIEKIRFTTSGTEAVMIALRLARAFTKRKKIIKFDGCYHGHSDSLLVSAGSGFANIRSSSLGIPDEFIKNTISLPFNDYKIFEKFIIKHYKQIAAVILEPIPGNMGLILPKDHFIKKIRKLTSKYDILLILDEIITGFRFCFGGIQDIFDIKPDLTCLGKIIGGGLPVGAIGGRKDIMNLLAPTGDVYHAGTFAGNPIVMKTGLEVLNYLKKNKTIYINLSDKTNLIAKEMKKLKNISFSCFGSMFTVFFTEKTPENFDDVKKSNFKRFKMWFIQMLNSGILLPPSQFEISFVSAAHSFKDIEKLIYLIKKYL